MHRTLLLLFTVSFLISSCESTSEETVTPEIELISHEPVEIKPEINEFGVDDRLDAATHTIKRNESFSTILRRNGLSPRQVHDLNIASEDVFNLRRIRAGRPLHIYTHTAETGEEGKVAYLVYEESRSDFIRYAISDSISATRESREIETRTRLVNGEINGSVYVTMRQLGVNPQLTHRLADVYAWQIDFYRIRPGDSFSVLFEERVLDGEVLEVGRIKAARFTHRDQDYYAFHYRQNEIDEYFDEDGNSLRRQFMAAPLDYTRISSRFTNRRYHPVLQRNMPHHGTDYAAPVGTPIRAVGDGEVTVARYDRNNGNYVRIRHNSVYETGYLHMSRFAEGIGRGTRVEQGQIIGYVGATGLATGPHLCFRFWQHGQPVDPRRIDLPPADPIKTEHRVAFLYRAEELLQGLEIKSDSIIQVPVTFAENIGYSGILSKNNSGEMVIDL